MVAGRQLDLYSYLLLLCRLSRPDNTAGQLQNQALDAHRCQLRLAPVLQASCGLTRLHFLSAVAAIVDLLLPVTYSTVPPALLHRVLMAN